MSFSSSSDKAAAAADRTPLNTVHCLLLLLLLLLLLPFSLRIVVYLGMRLGLCMDVCAAADTLFCTMLCGNLLLYCCSGPSNLGAAPCCSWPLDIIFLMASDYCRHRAYC
jgi:hypothetical protein